MVIKVAVNGYGTIGKRVADSFNRTNGFRVVGIVKYNPDYSTFVAFKRGFKVYVPRDRVEIFEKHGFDVSGTFDELLNEADVVVDATPPGLGLKYREIYVKYGKPAVFQGGENHHVAEVSFNTLCNYDEALSRKYIRVVSCNTTGLLRTVCLLDEFIGVEKVKAVIVRRAADPREDDKGPVNSVKLDSITIPSHHAFDVKMVKPGLDIDTVALITPTTLMHVQVLFIKLKDTVTKDRVIDVLSKVKRISLIDASLSNVDSTSKLIEVARDLGRLRNDIYENVIWLNSIKVDGSEVVFIQAIHQESIVIPENVDAVKAIFNLDTDKWKVVRETDESLGVGYFNLLTTSLR